MGTGESNGLAGQTVRHFSRCAQPRGPAAWQRCKREAAHLQWPANFRRRRRVAPLRAERGVDPSEYEMRFGADRGRGRPRGSRRRRRTRAKRDCGRTTRRERRKARYCPARPAPFGATPPVRRRRRSPFYPSSFYPLPVASSKKSRATAGGSGSSRPGGNPPPRARFGKKEGTRER
ncbi:hypothetical protein Mp_1g20030 [Marchantia polymorpha subsp. ruderalis]|uniref:Uncharacterized protein n=2 Tax=Marchantia polymorpha TaxID=3197 RepID=A0AAF6AS44_MARPO|nr:hypothetical protein MARPO_0001s0340 [Marchantia polymorpha]BBM99264.1 hypothetical protein Mp_1g20030 [Marchantia polymorpha subsp. ruderalis]|eukprot:PTQ50346.1 hypothetical protein MARPO_0001s0340 [Marchantia polymorpha]